MSWAAVCDRFWQHPKVLELRESEHHDTAVALWALAVSYVCGNEKIVLTGEVPRLVPASLGLSGDVLAAAAALVEVGLWEVIPDKGWRFHDWDQWNGPEAKHNRQKEQSRARTHKYRFNKCQGGSHSKDCPMTDLDGNPWACPKRNREQTGTTSTRTTRSPNAVPAPGPPTETPRHAASRDAGTGRAGTGRDGPGAPTKEPVPRHTDGSANQPNNSAAGARPKGMCDVCSLPLPDHDQPCKQRGLIADDAETLSTSF